MASIIDNRYWHVLLPEHGAPRITGCRTQGEFTQLLSAPLPVNGWVFCFFGYALPILPDCCGFMSPTGRPVVHPGISPDGKLVPVQDNFFTAKPQPPVNHRLIET